MSFNVLLVRWAGGWLERKDTVSVGAVGRIEGFLSLGATTTEEEAVRLADAQLAEFAAARQQTDLSIIPADDTDTPYLGFGVRDTITIDGEDHVVLGMTVTEDQATGEAMFTPQLNDDLVLDAAARSAQWQRKFTPGSLGGRSKVAVPAIPFYQNVGLVPLGPDDGNPPGCISESFDEPDSTTIGPDLLWVSSAYTGTYTGRAEVHSDKFAVGAAAAGPYYGLQANIRSIGGVTGGPDMVVSAVVGDVAAGETSAHQHLGVGARIVDKNAAGLAHAGDDYKLGYWLIVQQAGASGPWEAAVYYRDVTRVSDLATGASRGTPGNSFTGMTTLGAPIVAGDVLTVKVTGTGTSTLVEGYVNGVLVVSETMGSGLWASLGNGVAFSPSYWLDRVGNPGLDLDQIGSFPTSPVSTYALSFESMEACPFVG